MHEGDALAKRGVEDRLAFFDIHLDANRFKTNGVNCSRLTSNFLET